MISLTHPFSLPNAVFLPNQGSEVLIDKKNRLFVETGG